MTRRTDSAPRAGVVRPSGRHGQHGTGRCLDDPSRRSADDATGLRAFAHGANDAKIHETVGELGLQPIVERSDCHVEPGIVDLGTPGSLEESPDPVLRLPPAQIPGKRILRRARSVRTCRARAGSGAARSGSGTAQRPRPARRRNGASHRRKRGCPQIRSHGDARVCRPGSLPGWRLPDPQENSSLAPLTS
jgi:hypothetical protein